MKRVWSPGVLEEVAAAIEYVDAQRPGHGDRLRQSLEHTLLNLEVFPESVQIQEGTARLAVLRDFPYNVIYRIKDDELLVVAFLHGRRNPDHWRSRFSESD